MHKIFAKTLFLGKNVVFLPQCHSTNEEAKSLNLSGGLSEGTVVWTDYQEKGRGQQGNAWISDSGKNLLFTLFLVPKFLSPQNQYLLNVISSLAVRKTLGKYLLGKKVEIKWPNDIYVNDLKIAGILTETSISNGQLEQVYCGIGLNVNQSHFNLPLATSMMLESSKTFDRDQVLEEILIDFETYYRLADIDTNSLLDEYGRYLRWRNEIRSFLINKEEFKGIIQGINEQGKLSVRIGNDLRQFDVKEIEFLH